MAAMKCFTCRELRIVVQLKGEKKLVYCELVSLLSAQYKVFTSELIWLVSLSFAPTFRHQHQPSTSQHIVLLGFSRRPLANEEN